MRKQAFPAVIALALGAAACAPQGPPAARARLDCPARQGDLVRIGQAPDGKACSYRSGETDVQLQLTPVKGDAETTLAAIETSLTTPASQSRAAKPEAPGGTPASEAEREAERIAKQAERDSAWRSNDSGRVVIDKPGETVVIDEGAGGRADIKLPGLQIQADDRNAKVSIGGVHIDAQDDQATVHVLREVRLRGEALSREKRGVRATFIARRDDLPAGNRFVGYEAAGPKTGPLAVALVRARSDIDDSGRLYHDVQRLVRRNGGV